jgi:hypothetical protein
MIKDKNVLKYGNRILSVTFGQLGFEVSRSTLLDNNIRAPIDPKTLIEELMRQ